MRQDAAEQNAEHATKAILSDLEGFIDGSPGHAAIAVNSALAAVEVIVARYDLRKEVLQDLYEQVWIRVVNRILER